MYGTGPGLRAQGVQNVNNENRAAPVKRLLNCQKMETYAVELGNEQGQLVTTVLIKIGEQLYTDPNAEAWAKALRPIDGKSWLAKQFSEAIAAQSNVVPTHDAVDVLGSGK